MSGPLADWQIRGRMALPPGDPHRLVIEPFAEPTKTPGVVGYGLTSFGYDIRLGRKFRAFWQGDARQWDHVFIDPTNFCADVLMAPEVERDAYYLDPRGYVLAESLEYMELPDDVLAVVLGKSTLARCGLSLNTTPGEPGWRGKWTLEIANLTDFPAVLRAGHGVGQVVFLAGDATCDVPYHRKAGASYQDQQGLTLPRHFGD